MPLESEMVLAHPCPSIRHALICAPLIAVPSAILTEPVMVLLVLLKVMVPKSFSALSLELMLKV